MALFKRKKDDGEIEVTASLGLDLAKPFDAKYLRNAVMSSKHIGRLPWKWYQSIGEVHYAISRNARIGGYARIRAYKLEKDGSIGDIVTSGQPAEIAEMFSSPYGGQRALIDRYFTHMNIPGESYLVRLRDEKGKLDGYDWVAAPEIDVSSLDEKARMLSGQKVYTPGTPIRRITSPAIAGSGQMQGSDQLDREILAGDMLGRVWRPGGMYVDTADSPLLALETTCELLFLLTQNLKGKLLNRLALNGVFFVPSNMNDIQAGGPEPKPGTHHQNRVLNALITAATFAVTNFDDPVAALPIFMSGNPEFADKIRHIVTDRDIAETDMKLRAELIDRVLMGLDVQPSIVRGMGDSNHWSSWAVSDDERRVNIQPHLETMCWAATRMVLHAEMQAANRKPGDILKHVLWYDLTAANVKTNLGEDARQAHDRLVINDEGTRLLTGISEAHALKGPERIRAIGVKMSIPYLATFALDEAKDIDWSKVNPVKTGPDANSPADKPETSPGKGPSSSTPTPESDTPKSQRPA